MTKNEAVAMLGKLIVEFEAALNDLDEVAAILCDDNAPLQEEFVTELYQFYGNVIKNYLIKIDF